MIIDNLKDAHSAMKKKFELVKNIQTAFQETLNQICQSLDRLQTKLNKLLTNQVNHQVDMTNLIGQQVKCQLSVSESRLGKQPLKDDHTNSQPIHQPPP